MSTKTCEFNIETASNGDHVISFPRRNKVLVPPEVHEEKMDWIRDSYTDFFQHVREREALLRHSAYN